MLKENFPAKLLADNAGNGAITVVFLGDFYGHKRIG